MGMLVIGIILGLIVIAVYGAQRKQRKILNDQKSGLRHIKQVKLLISLLQKHRGLSAAWCQGDSSVMAELNLLKSDIRKVVIELEGHGLTQQFDRFAAFQDHWSRLAKHKDDLSAESSFKQHTHMIANVLYLLEDVAEKYHLSQEFLPEFTHVGYLWRELLAVTESVGQSRAVGTSAVTAKQCSSVERIRLKFLRQHITHVSEKVLKQMKTGSDSELNKFIDQGVQHTRYLTSAIVNEILEPEEIVMQRSDYFDLATQTMDSLLSIFDHQVLQIELAVTK
ncbi:hypothetical protein C2869_10855 [Saccharobesus litoralis]|uniref:Nitrate/nitrite sensing protein domain-containing protein n=1 Tax=Saccharobesus litoralis TaxID=2172099 RepID=A0A2S0VRV9_9ALTE|nr:nitrate- and nitrite sensing domain-containing protein [Saccharobesus litoralis]AWB66902.1 hypothetical protein C2869_10855 [Saccharobesus litoralis]